MTMKMVMKRGLVSFVLVALIFGVLGMTACGKGEPQGIDRVETGFQSQGTDTDGKTTDGSSTESKVADVANQFVMSIINKDYDKTLSLMGMDGADCFISKEDIGYQIPRSKYSVLAEEVGANTTGSTGATDTTGNAETNGTNGAEWVTKVIDKSATKYHTRTLKNGDESGEPIDISVVLSKDNNWVVSDDSLYAVNYTFRAPSGIKIYANGKEVPKSLIVKSNTGSTGLLVDYKLPYVSKSKVKLKAQGTYCNYEGELAVTSNNEYSDDANYFCCNVSPEEETKALDYIKTAWNGLYKEYASGKNSTQVSGYISDKADSDMINIIWDGFKSMEKCSSKGNDNFRISTVVKNEDYPICYVSDDVVLVNFKYQLQWHYKLADWDESLKRKSYILLQKDKTGYKLYKVMDEGLFNHVNSFTKEW